jgi:hypothetical protein
VSHHHAILLVDPMNPVSRKTRETFLTWETPSAVAADRHRPVKEIACRSTI